MNAYILRKKRLYVIKDGWNSTHERCIAQIFDPAQSNNNSTYSHLIFVLAIPDCRQTGWFLTATHKLEEWLFMITNVW